MIDNRETQMEIAAEVRDLSGRVKDNLDVGMQGLLPTVYGKPFDVYLAELADRIEAAAKREAESIERIIRDAVVDYNGMYCDAPNDDAEREVVERAKTANSYLTSHGMTPEPFYHSKEESSCL